MRKKNTRTATHQSSLAPGQKAPEFEGTDQHGNTVRLKDFYGKNLILYFYPKDNTPTCTNQACNLRDHAQVLNDANYTIIGVSPDSKTSHSNFANKHSLPFPLIADTDKSIINAYDVYGTKESFGRVYEGIVRTTFVINAQGTIQEIIREVDSKNHAEQILNL